MPPDPTLAGKMAAILADWESGQSSRNEIDNRIWDLLTPTNIEEVVTATPAGELRDELVDHLRNVGGGDGPLITIFGGIYSWEMEPDPVRRAEMMAEVEREKAARAARFERLMRPAIRAWMGRSKPTTAEQVAAVIAAWNEGMLTDGEVGTKIVALLTATNVDEVWAATPEAWRADLMARLEALASDEKLLSIGFALYAYQLEPDPLRRAEMKAAVDRETAAHEEHVEQVIRPAVRAWMRQRSSSSP